MDALSEVLPKKHSLQFIEWLIKHCIIPKCGIKQSEEVKAPNWLFSENIYLLFLCTAANDSKGIIKIFILFPKGQASDPHNSSQC